MNDIPTHKSLEIPKLEDDEAIIKISGFFNQKNMEDLERALSTIDQKKPRTLSIDCSQLVHLDTPNIALLVGKHNEYRVQGRSMVLRSVPPSVMKILKLSRLDNILHIDTLPAESSDLDLDVGVPKVPTPGEVQGIIESMEIDERHMESTRRILSAYRQLHEESLGLDRSPGDDFASTLFRSSSDTIFLFNPVDGFVVDGNPLARERVGVNDFSGEKVLIHQLCSELKSDEKPWAEAPDTQGGARIALDQTWQFSENVRRQMKVTYVPVDHPDEGYVMAICQDVTPEWDLEVENRNLQKQLKGSLRDLSFLEKRTRDFNRLLEREPLCFSILDGALEVVQEAEAGMVLLFNSQLNRLTVRAAIGFPRSDRLSQVSLKQGEVFPGIQSELFWHHLKSDPSDTHSIEIRTSWEEAVRPRIIRASLVYPLVSQQAQVGFLVLVSFDNTRAFRKYDEELLDSLTLAGATALEKSFLVERIRFSEIHLRSILESIPISVFSVDDQSHVDTWNYESEKLFGWNAGDAVGRHYRKFYSDENSEEATQLNHALEALSPWEGEIEVKTKLGETVPTRHIVQPFLNTEGIKKGMVFVVEDIRRLIELRDQMMKAQKLESVGVLAGGIAHDFNNLIGAILGYASFLRSQLGDDDKNTRYAEVIESTAEQASQLTRKLLEFASGSSDQKILTEIRGLLEDCLELVKPSIPVGVKLTLQLSPDPIYAFVSPTAIQQVIMNLCLNARDALAEEGKIDVRLQERDDLPSNLMTPAPPKVDTKWTVLEVSDSGPGIEDSLVAEIFKPFFTTKSAGKGSGLGLAMVYRTVVDHGGWMELDTELEKGTTFRIGLPMNEVTSKGDEATESKGDSNRGKSVLVVDDEPLVRELAMTVLESSGYQVKCAEDGAQALEMFKSDPDSFSIAIVDVLMPVMGGEELVKEIEKIRPGFPILLSSGYAPKTSLDERIKTGEIEFLPKPYRSRQLLEKIEQMLSATS